MTLSTRLSDLAARIGAEVKALRGEVAGKADAAHTHTAAQVGAAPTSHTHTASQLNSGVLAAARLPAASETAAGAVELATIAEVNSGTDSTRAVTPAALAVWGALIRPGGLKRSVFIGSSNATGAATSWPAKLSTIRGWTMHNYAIGGQGYTSSAATNFAAQVQNAIAGMSVSERAEVGHFFVGDASNDARANATYETLLGLATSLFTTIRANFPNAKIVVLPIVWPADAQKYAPTASFPYDQKWNASAMTAGQAQADALSAFSNARYLDESWTWLTGHDEWMLALNDVHPNPDGHTVIANLVDRALDGEDVVPTTGWQEVTPLASGWGFASTPQWGRRLSVRRRGWSVDIEGAIKSGAAWGGSYIDFAAVPYGFRPTWLTPVYSLWQGTRAPVPVEIYPGNGIMRLAASSASANGPHIVASYRMG